MVTHGPRFPMLCLESEKQSRKGRYPGLGLPVASPCPPSWNNSRWPQCAACLSSVEVGSGVILSLEIGKKIHLSRVSVCLVIQAAPLGSVSSVTLPGFFHRYHPNVS